MKHSATLVAVASAVLLAVPAGASARATSVDSATLIPRLYKNCTNLQMVSDLGYPNCAVLLAEVHMT